MTGKREVDEVSESEFEQYALDLQADPQGRETGTGRLCADWLWLRARVSALEAALMSQCPACVKEGAPRDIHSGIPTDYHGYAYRVCRLTASARALVHRTDQ